MESRFVSRQECVDALMKVLSDSPTRQATRHFGRHIPRLSWTFSLVPIAESAGEKLLDIGSKLDIVEIFRGRHGYSQIGSSVYMPDGAAFHERSATSPDTTVYHFNGEKMLISCEPGDFNVVTCFEVIEHMTSDPMALMGNINRAMALGGHLVISTLNCASLKSIKKILKGGNPLLYSHFNLNLSANRHNREYTARELMRTVTCGGFEILETITPFVFSEDDPEFTEKLKALGINTKFLGDDTVILARKISDEIVRYPAHLYVRGNDARKVDSQDVFTKSRAVAREMIETRKSHVATSHDIADEQV